MRQYLAKQHACCKRLLTLLFVCVSYICVLQMYTFPDWKKHRSSYRYVHHMHTILE